MNVDRGQMIPLAEAVRRYGVAYSTLGRWIGIGWLKSWKFPLDRKTYVHPKDVEALIEQPRRGRPGRWRKNKASSITSR